MNEKSTRLACAFAIWAGAWRGCWGTFRGLRLFIHGNGQTFGNKPYIYIRTKNTPRWIVKYCQHATNSPTWEKQKKTDVSSFDFLLLRLKLWLRELHAIAMHVYPVRLLSIILLRTEIGSKSLDLLGTAVNLTSYLRLWLCASVRDYFSLWKKTREIVVHLSSYRSSKKVMLQHHVFTVTSTCQSGTLLCVPCSPMYAQSQQKSHPIKSSETWL